MSNDKEIYFYQTWDRLELPFDLSKKALAGKIGCSCHQIDNALKALDKKNGDVLNSCYSKLVRGRRAGIPPINQHSNQLDTTTFAFYWEIIELLEALITAKVKNKRTNGDDLARCTFAVLADSLSKALADSVNLNFAQKKIISNPNVQNEMNRKFIGEAIKRLDTVKYIVEHDPTSEQILTVCVKLDSLIAEWTHNKNFDYYESKEITVQSIEELYDNLMEVRKNRYVAKALEKYIPYDAELQIPPIIRFDAPPDIIDNLQEHLPSGTKRIKDNRQLAELVKAYEQFLLSNTDENEIDSINSSIKEYCALENYVHPRENLDKAFESAIREDLINFVKDQFSDLEHLKYIPFTYSTYHSTSLQTNYLKERIKNVQSRIMYEFNKPFQLLRIFYSIRNFVYFDSNDSHSIDAINSVLKKSPPFGQLIIQMEKEIFRLGMENPQLPLVKSNLEFSEDNFFSEYLRQIPKEQFLEEYRNSVVPILSKEPEMLEKILEALTNGTYSDNITWESMSVSSLLLWSCQIVIFDSINEWTKSLKDDLVILTKFYSEFEQFQKRSSSNISISHNVKQNFP